MARDPMLEAVERIAQADKGQTVSDAWAITLDMFKIMAPIWKVQPDQVSPMMAKMADELAKEISNDRA